MNMNKSKLAIIAPFMFCCCTTLCAQQVSVDLTIDHTGGIHTSHPSAHPTVTYDDDEVTIKSDSTIQDLNVVIRDQYGQVLYNSAVTVSQSGTIIYVPDDGDSEKTTIDLYYNREHAKGYF